MHPNTRWLAVALTFLLAAGASAQGPVHERTRIVDPDGTPDANFETIQEAIDDITVGAGEVWTVLIYAGEYPENITLGTGEANINLVGVDRESVIIKPSTGKGIVVSGSGDRNNNISNLTVISADDDGIVLGSGCSLTNVAVQANNNGKNAVKADEKSDIRIMNSSLVGDIGLLLDNNCTNVTVRSTSITAQDTGVHIMCGDNVFFQSCNIFAGNDPLGTADQRGLWIEHGDGEICNIGDITALLCTISAEGNNSSIPTCRAVQVDDTPVTPEDKAPRQVRIVSCKISSKSSYAVETIGVYGGDDKAVHVFTSEITTSSDAEKETDVFDLVNGANLGNDELGVLVGGCDYSKWKGPIGSAERLMPMLHRALSVDQSSATAVLGTTSLTGSEQTITSGITNPDVYRVLSVQGSALTTQTVYIVGTNWADDAITDSISLSGTSVVNGVKPFKTVTKIILPAQTNGGQEVSVGTTDLLGMISPISDAADVIQQAQLNNDDVYEIETLGTVDDVYGSIDPGTIGAGGPSYEWAVLGVE